MTPDDYFNWHIPHRLNLLVAFRNRFSGRQRHICLHRDQFKDLFRCAKDCSFVMTRFFCEEFGLVLDRKTNDVEDIKPGKHPWKSRFGSRRVPKSELKSDRRYSNLRDMLMAANRAVAHLDERDVDHSFKGADDDERIYEVIDWIEELVRKKLYEPAGRDFEKSMGLQQNVMHE